MYFKNFCIYIHTLKIKIEKFFHLIISFLKFLFQRFLSLSVSCFIFIHYLWKILFPFFFYSFIFFFIFPVKYLFFFFKKIFTYSFIFFFNFVFQSFFTKFFKKFFFILIIFIYYAFVFKYFFLIYEEEFYFFQKPVFSFYNFTHHAASDFLSIQKKSSFSSTSPFVFFYNDFPNFFESLDFPFKSKVRFDVPSQRGFVQFYYGNLLQHSHDWFNNLDLLDYWSLRRKFSKGWIFFDTIFEFFSSFSVFQYSISFAKFGFLFLIDMFFFPIVLLVIFKYTLIVFLSNFSFSFFSVDFFFFSLCFRNLNWYFIELLFKVDDIFLMNILLSFRLLFLSIFNLLIDDFYGLIFRYYHYVIDNTFTIESYISNIFYNSSIDLKSSFHLRGGVRSKARHFHIFRNLYYFPAQKNYFKISNILEPNLFFASLNFYPPFLNLKSYHFFNYYDVPSFFFKSRSVSYPKIDNQFLYFFQIPFKIFEGNDYYYSRLFRYNFFSLDESFYRDFFDFWFYGGDFKSNLNYTRKLPYLQRLMDYLINFNDSFRYNFLSNFKTDLSMYNSKSDFYRKFYRLIEISDYNYDKWRLRKGVNRSTFNFNKHYFWSSHTYNFLTFILNVFYGIFLNLKYSFSYLAQFILFYCYIQIFLLFIFIFRFNLVFFYKIFFDFYKNNEHSNFNLFIFFNFFFYGVFVLFKNLFLLLECFFFSFIKLNFLIILRRFFLFFFKSFWFIIINIIKYYFKFFIRVFLNFFSLKFLFFVFLFCIYMLFYFFLRGILFFFKIFFFFFLLQLYIYIFFFSSLQISLLNLKPYNTSFHQDSMSEYYTNYTTSNLFYYILFFEDSVYLTLFLIGLLLFFILFLSLFSDSFRKNCLGDHFVFYRLELINDIESKPQPGQVFDFFRYQYVSEHNDDFFARRFNYIIRLLPQPIGDFIEEQLSTTDRLSGDLSLLIVSGEPKYKDYFWEGKAPFQYTEGDQQGKDDFLKTEKRDINFLFKFNSPTYFISENRVSSFNGNRFFDYSHALKSSSINLESKYYNEFLDNPYFYLKSSLFYKGRFFINFCDHKLLKYSYKKGFNSFYFLKYYSSHQSKHKFNDVNFFKTRSVFSQKRRFFVKHKVLNNLFLFKYVKPNFIDKKNIIYINKSMFEKFFSGFKFTKIDKILDFKQFIFLNYESLAKNPIVLKKNIRFRKKFLKRLLILLNKHKEFHSNSEKLKIGEKNAPFLYDVVISTKLNKGKFIRNFHFFPSVLFFSQNHFYFDLFYRNIQSAFFYGFLKYKNNYNFPFKKLNSLPFFFYNKKSFPFYLINKNFFFFKDSFSSYFLNKKKIQKYSFLKKALLSLDDSFFVSTTDHFKYLNIILRSMYEKSYFSLRFFKILEKNPEHVNSNYTHYNNNFRNIFLSRDTFFGRDFSTRWGYYLNRNIWNFNYIFDEDDERPFIFLNDYFSASFDHYSGPLSFHNSLYLNFDPEFDFLNNYDNYEHAFDLFDFMDVFFDPYEDEHPFSEKYFSSNYEINSLTFFPSLIKYDIPLQLFNFNKSFQYSDELYFRQSLWVFDSFLDNIFINTLNDNIILSSDRFSLINFSKIFSSLEQNDYDIIKLRSNYIRCLIIQYFKNLPLFSMRKLNRFFWLRSTNSVLISPFVTGSDDFFLYSSNFNQWQTAFFQNINNFNILNSQFLRKDVSKYFEDFLSSNFTIFFYNPYNKLFLSELKKVLGFYTVSLNLNDMFCNKFKRKFFNNMENIIFRLELSNFPLLTKEEFERLCIFLGCTSKEWNSVDDNFKLRDFIYDVWDFPIVFFFILFISFSGKIYLASFFSFFNDFGNVSGINELFLNSTDIPQVAGFNSNFHSLYNFDFHIEINPFNFFICFEKLFLPLINSFSFFLNEFFFFVVFCYNFYLNFWVYFNYISFYDLYYLYLTNFASNEFKIICNTFSIFFSDFFFFKTFVTTNVFFYVDAFHIYFDMVSFMKLYVYILGVFFKSFFKAVFFFFYYYNFFFFNFFSLAISVYFYFYDLLCLFWP